MAEKARTNRKIHKWRLRRHTHTLPREYSSLCGEQIYQIFEERGALLPSQTVLKRLGDLVNARGQAWHKALVCLSFAG